MALTPEEKRARREENKRKWAEAREADMEERRARREQEREERRMATQTINFVPPPEAEDYLGLPPEKRKELLKEWLWNVAMNSPSIPAKDRLTAAGQLSRLEGFEKQEIKIEVDAVTRFFDKEFSLMDAEPPAWLRSKQQVKVIEVEAEPLPTGLLDASPAQAEPSPAP